MQIDDFTLFSGVPIIYKSLEIRQPRLVEIGRIGEQLFYDYISYFLLDKEKMMEHSPNAEQLKSVTTTQFIMLLISEQPDILQKINLLFMLLVGKLMIIDFNEQEAKLKLVGNTEDEIFTLEDNDWNEIVSIIKQIFCITGEMQYNTKKNAAASRIAEKLQAAKKKIENMKKRNGFQPMLTQYCSILSVGSSIPVTEIINDYTLNQLMQQLKRFNKYEEYHIQLNAMVHGAKIDKLTTWYGNMNENNDSSKVEPTKTNLSGVKVNNKKRN